MTQIKKQEKKAKNTKIAKNTTQISFFFTKSQKTEIFAFCVITFEPIKISTSKMTI